MRLLATAFKKVKAESYFPVKLPSNKRISLLSNIMYMK